MDSPKYLTSIISSLTKLKDGIGMHSALWNGQPVTEKMLDDIISRLETQQSALAKAERDLAKAKDATHNLVDSVEPTEKQAIKLAEAIHHNDPINLVDYGLDPSKVRTPLGTPGKAIIAAIKIEPNGSGFTLTIQSLTDALGFDIERTTSATADVLTVDPSTFALIGTSNKLTYTDNNIKPGIRYFYRVRGTNRTSKGDWSSFVSIIQ